MISYAWGACTTGIPLITRFMRDRKAVNMPRLVCLCVRAAHDTSGTVNLVTCCCCCCWVVLFLRQVLAHNLFLCIFSGLLMVSMIIDVAKLYNLYGFWTIYSDPEVSAAAAAAIVCLSVVIVTASVCSVAALVTWQTLLL